MLDLGGAEAAIHRCEPAKQSEEVDAKLGAGHAEWINANSCRTVTTLDHSLPFGPKALTTLPDALAFILEAIDEDLLYPCLATRLRTTDLAKLRSVLAINDDDDPSLEKAYFLSPSETVALCDAFDLKFDAGMREVVMFKDCVHSRSPYLFHTGYELPLLLEGRKKLAFFYFDSGDHSSFVSRLKERFDHYVAAGLLHAEEDLYALPDHDGRSAGEIYYAAKGEAWRIPALRLIRKASGVAGGWNEIFERLEGTLMGYEDWQNDWWLDLHARGDGSIVYGMSFRCAVSKAGLDWVIQSGHRALPPVEGATLTIQSSHALEDETMELALRENPDVEAFVQFNLGGCHLMGVCDLRTTGPFLIPAIMVSDINRNLTRQVCVVARR
ncbi:hypothetical protein PO002_32380 [Cupriavidus necator]|uniref:hypothetical protein n=1 Tax=Cupriavidus necator TaxID=106590 RepID=UPI0039C3CFEC